MGLNSINPHYHGLVKIDDKNWIDGETPVEDYGCFYYSEEDFPSDRDWMFEKFLSFMDDEEDFKWY